MRKTDPKIIEQIRQARDKGCLQWQTAERLSMTPQQLNSLCRHYKIRGWPTGAAARNQFGSKNPMYKGGLSRASVNRTTKLILKSVGRDLFTCERCGTKRDIELPRHHRNRDRSNNEPENLEVLCVSCHNKEHTEERLRCSTTGRFERIWK
jgi:5-methylcytosine-specific restriction endonuclease McrA